MNNSVCTSVNLIMLHGLTLKEMPFSVNKSTIKYQSGKFSFFTSSCWTNWANENIPCFCFVLDRILSFFFGLLKVCISDIVVGVYLYNNTLRLCKFNWEESWSESKLLNINLHIFEITWELKNASWTRSIELMHPGM